MPGAYQCPVCERYYDTKTRKPLCLPCGHTFCKSCLEYPTPSPKTCALCRVPWRCSVDSLPVCYQLIPDKPNPDDASASGSQAGGRQAPDSSCKKHNFQLEFWCQTCFRELCKKCLVEQHSSCKTVLIDDVVKISRSAPAEDAVKWLKQNLASDLASTQKNILRNKESLDQVVRFLGVVESIKVQLESERAVLQSRKGAIEKLSKNVNDVSQCWTKDKKSKVLHYATEYHADIKEQNNAFFSDAQLGKLTELCNFAKSFIFPMRNQNQGGYGGWGSYFFFRR